MAVNGWMLSSDLSGILLKFGYSLFCSISLLDQTHLLSLHLVQRIWTPLTGNSSLCGGQTLSLSFEPIGSAFIFCWLNYIKETEPFGEYPDKQQKATLTSLITALVAPCLVLNSQIYTRNNNMNQKIRRKCRLRMHSHQTPWPVPSMKATSGTTLLTYLHFFN